MGGVPSMGVFLRDPRGTPRVSEKTTENSERLGQQARPGIERGTSEKNWGKKDENDD